jgi:hypothetical protein
MDITKTLQPRPGMRDIMLAAFDKIARRASRSMPFAKKRGLNFDIEEIALFKAACEAVEFYDKGLNMALKYPSDLDLLSHAIEIALKSGLVLEFGVASGRTISHIAARTTRTVYGFDSFEGIPEAWAVSIKAHSLAICQPFPPTFT